MENFVFNEYLRICQELYMYLSAFNPQELYDIVVLPRVHEMKKLRVTPMECSVGPGRSDFKDKIWFLCSGAIKVIKAAGPQVQRTEPSGVRATNFEQEGDL